MNIKNISALEILDSRGIPTLKTFVELENGVVGWSEVPSGASTGTYEAHELRDNDPKRYFGKGVLTAKHNVEVVLNELLAGKDAANQSEIDKLMLEADGTENKTKLGANAILSVSLACARAVASAQKQELYEYLAEMFGHAPSVLPVPLINVINGGKHAENSVDFQEYMLVPYGFPKFSEALRAASEVFNALKKILHGKKLPTTVGDEGGFAPNLNSNREPLELLLDAIESAGYVPGQEFALALDVAASEIFQNNKYNLAKENKQLSQSELAKYYQQLREDFPLFSIEDPFSEDDWQGFVNLTASLGSRTQIVGDDLYVTNLERFKKGIELQATNAILIKLNQIGTLTETIEVIKMAQGKGIQTIISHRSGETTDSFIADFAVAAAAGQIKTGSLSRSERLAKYNRLLEIEASLENPVYFQFPYTNNGNGY